MSNSVDHSKLAPVVQLTTTGPRLTGGVTCDPISQKSQKIKHRRLTHPAKPYHEQVLAHRLCLKAGESSAVELPFFNKIQQQEKRNHPMDICKTHTDHTYVRHVRQLIGVALALALVGCVSAGRIETSKESSVTDQSGDAVTTATFLAIDVWASVTVEDVVELLANGADVNERDSESNRTPLHLAVRDNVPPVVLEALLDAGADPNAEDNDSLVPLHFAAPTPNSGDNIALLVRYGADADARADGFTPLDLALYENNSVNVMALLESGADPNARDEWGGTPLHLAADYSADPSVVSALVAAGADPNARNSIGTTPIFGVSNPWTAEALIKAGADVNAAAPDNSNPLYVVSRQDLVGKDVDYPTVEVLLKAGAVCPEGTGLVNNQCR